MKRVLVLGSVLGQPAGGVRRHAAELWPRVARRLAAEGGALAVALGTGGLGFELPDEVELLPTTIPPHPPLVRATLEGRWVRRLAAEARAQGRPFDLVHTAHHPVPRHLPLPHALLVHDLRALSLEHSPFSRRLFARQILGQGVERAAVVATVSEAVRAQVLRTFRVRPERVHVVPNGVDHLALLPRAAASDAPLLVLGHLEPRKNAALVLAALALDATLPRVVFAGAAKGDEEARLRRRADELGVAARVTFAGPVDDAELPRRYAEAACVVCPSALEGFGLVPAEAARAGAPLALSEIPAHVEVAAPTTPRFAPDDAAGCAAAIRAALAASPADLEAARAHVARLTWDDAAARLLAAWSAAAT